ncbi:glycosyltransferase family 2 protein [Neobacillus mesonae]|uniref:glycosyltransferase family 2 protein n=1 Tax=Neobacillus mesonae TaxID=1193713 RepID=UPI00203C554B|nr:glycosyltransferase family 2 protein [Neobacillus mesonae]MCM3568213.1 glycosyltransferase family 2 protein [Neobacillus mesonae]
MKPLTIFTPTYNRAYCLHKCYESLKKQTCKDFVWLIIDDGSTDNTKGLVQKWINESIIEIIYHYQENQGMHGAHNTAYQLIETELNVCIDSDDYMPIQAVAKILAMWSTFGSEHVSGIIGLDSFPNGEIIGSRLPDNIKSSNLFDLYYFHGVTGDKKLVYRTELTKKYPYPVFQDEKYVGLAYKYYKIDQQYKMLLMNEVLCCVEYLPDGSSLNMLRQYRKNPNGFSFYRKELMKLPYTSNSFKFRQAIHYVSSNLMLRNWRFLVDTPYKGLTTLAIPLGFLLYLYIHTKTRNI